MRTFPIKIALFISLLIASTSSSFAIISEQDKQLNKNINAFTPIYCSVKRVPWEFWGRKYEFALQVMDSEPVKPNPVSEINSSFIGYKNKATKIKVVCHKLDPIYSRVVATDVLGVFDVDELDETLHYTIKDLGKPDPVQISFSVHRDKRDIEVIDSGKFMHIFKAYNSARIFNVSFDVKSLRKS